jgi:hypothetical protein
VPGQTPSFDRGAHACLLYQTPDEQKSIVLPFVREGLLNGEHCVYVTDEQSAEDWSREAQAFGVDAEAAQAAGRLFICSGDTWLERGDFDSIANARRAWEQVERALRRFRGIRVVVDAGWMRRPDITTDRLCHWEATINPLLAGDFEARVICQYNLSRHTAPVIHSALRTHPVLVLDGRIRANPYYEAPLILEREPHLNGSSADAAAVEEMLASLRGV